MDRNDHGRFRAAVAAAVLAILLAAMAVPAGSEDSDAGPDTWRCTVTVDGSSVVTRYAENGSEPSATEPVRGNDGNAAEGSWGFDADGYGPFGSFYAAFDISTGAIAYHLDPCDLSRTVAGETIDTARYNTMWVLPTVWMEVVDVGSDGNGSTLVMSNVKESEGMEAPAHTIDGKVYNYLALGVYEANDADGKLVSRPGETPLVPWYGQGDRHGWAEKTGVDTGHSMMWNFYQWQLYRFCSIAVMQSFDSQGRIGMGNVDGTVQDTGSTEKAGPYYGKSEADPDGVKLFIENAWGNVWQHIGDTGLIWGLSAGQHSKQHSWYGGTDVVKSYQWLVGYGTAPYSTDLATWGLPTKTGASGETAPDYIRTNGYGYPLTVGGNCESGSGAGLTSQLALWYGDPSTTRLAFVFEEDAAASVRYDHSGLTELLEEYGYDADLVDGLPKSMPMAGRTCYEQLDDVPDGTGFRHVGWIVDGKEYPATHRFVFGTAHTAKSVWVGMPAVTYDHSRLVGATGDPDSVSGLSDGLRIKGNDRYERLPDRDGYEHIGWLIGGTEVGPTDPFVTRTSHTAVSLWSAVPTVVLDHRGLTDIVGWDAGGVSGLPTGLVISENEGYIQLPDTAGYRHIGWRIGDVTVGPTAGFLSEGTHTAFSLWQEMPDDGGFVPMPDDGRWDDGPFVPEEKERGKGRTGDAGNILIVAVLAAIVAELAVLQISRRR